MPSFCVENCFNPLWHAIRHIPQYLIWYSHPCFLQCCFEKFLSWFSWSHILEFWVQLLNHFFEVPPKVLNRVSWVSANREFEVFGRNCGERLMKSRQLSRWIWLKGIQMSPETVRQRSISPTAANFCPMPTRTKRPSVHICKKDGWYVFQRACSCNSSMCYRHRAKVLQNIGSVSFVPSGVYFIFSLLPHSSGVGSLRFDDFELCLLGARSLRGACILTGFTHLACRLSLLPKTSFL